MHRSHANLPGSLIRAGGVGNQFSELAHPLLVYSADDAMIYDCLEARSRAFLIPVWKSRAAQSDVERAVNGFKGEPVLDVRGKNIGVVRSVCPAATGGTMLNSAREREDWKYFLKLGSEAMLLETHRTILRVLSETQCRETTTPWFRDGQQMCNQIDVALADKLCSLLRQYCVVCHNCCAPCRCTDLPVCHHCALTVHTPLFLHHCLYPHVLLIAPYCNSMEDREKIFSDSDMFGPLLQFRFAQASLLQLDVVYKRFEVDRLDDKTREGFLWLALNVVNPD